MDERATVYGVGVVDIEIKTNDQIYIMWKYMLRKCYRPRGSRVSYNMCSEWLMLSNFYQFVSGCGGRSKSLKCGENKRYSPECCYFVEKRSVKKPVLKSEKRTGCSCSCTCGAAKLIE